MAFFMNARAFKIQICWELQLDPEMRTTVGLGVASCEGKLTTQEHSLDPLEGCLCEDDLTSLVHAPRKASQSRNHSLLRRLLEPLRPRVRGLLKIVH